jgi:hypothetical protein
MGQGLSGSSKPIIASTGQQQGTISDSGRSSTGTIRAKDLLWQVDSLLIKVVVLCYGPGSPRGIAAAF